MKCTTNNYSLLLLLILSIGIFLQNLISRGIFFDFYRSAVLNLAPILQIQATCSFSDIDVFIVTHSSASSLTHKLFVSIAKFMPKYHEIHIVTDTDNIKNTEQMLSTSIGRNKTFVHPLVMPGGFDSIPGYIAQAWVMMWADVVTSKSTAKYIMFLDTDSIFVMPVTCESIFMNHQPLMGYWSFERQPHFADQCEHFVGNCSGSFMSFFPFIMPRASFEPMRNHIARRTGATNFDISFLEWSKSHNVMDFSQFVLMGNFLLNHPSWNVKIFFCPDVKILRNDSFCATYLPPAIHFWRYCNYVGDCQTPSISIKYSDDFYNLIDEAIALGECHQRRAANGNLSLKCSELGITVHSWILTYQSRIPNQSAIAKIYY
jgi:hypothetical protein